jgi:hypothetical protein
MMKQPNRNDYDTEIEYDVDMVLFIDYLIVTQFVDKPSPRTYGCAAFDDDDEWEL